MEIVHMQIRQYGMFVNRRIKVLNLEYFGNDNLFGIRSYYCEGTCKSVIVIILWGGPANFHLGHDWSIRMF